MINQYSTNIRKTLFSIENIIINISVIQNIIYFLTSLIILHKTIFFDKVILRILSQLNYEILQDFNKIIELFLSFCLSHYLSNIEFDVTR